MYSIVGLGRFMSLRASQRARKDRPEHTAATFRTKKETLSLTFQSKPAPTDASTKTIAYYRPAVLRIRADCR